MRVLSGVQPSGTLHLGNYFGALVQYIALQNKYETFYFIADFHAMTTVHHKEQLRQNVFQVALDYLALGLDPEKCVLFRQSDVPEVVELAWILSTVGGKGLLDRATSYKDKVQKGISASIGLYYYPILMAADMLLYQTDLVPIGADQKQHIEIAQDLAQAFNHAYQTDILKRPEPLFNQTAKVPGIDGEKMSKSYGNYIGIFENSMTARKKIMSIKTDSLPMDAPKDPETCLLFKFLCLFAGTQEIADWEQRLRLGGVGYGQMKNRLFELYEEKFAPLRQKREQISSQPDYVESVLKKGAQQARTIAMQNLKQIRKLVGLL